MKYAISPPHHTDTAGVCTYFQVLLPGIHPHLLSPAPTYSLVILRAMKVGRNSYDTGSRSRKLGSTGVGTCTVLVIVFGRNYQELTRHVARIREMCGSRPCCRDKRVRSILFRFNFRASRSIVCESCFPHVHYCSANNPIVQHGTQCNVERRL